MGERVRARRVIVCGLLALLVLAGCTFPEPYPEIPRYAPSGGQTQAELDAKLAMIPGLVVENASGSKPNIKGNTGYGYDLNLDPHYRIADPERLFDFLVESAWSVRDGYMPNTSVRISLMGVPGDNLDLDVVAEQTGWAPVDSQARRGVADNGATSAWVWIDLDSSSAVSDGSVANRERLGVWPGEAPPVPSGVTELRSEVDDDSVAASPSPEPGPSVSSGSEVGAR